MFLFSPEPNASPHSPRLGGERSGGNLNSSGLAGLPFRCSMPTRVPCLRGADVGMGSELRFLARMGKEAWPVCDPEPRMVQRFCAPSENASVLQGSRTRHGVPQLMLYLWRRQGESRSNRAKESIGREKRCSQSHRFAIALRLKPY
jgi:hypothetical protein